MPQEFDNRGIPFAKRVENGATASYHPKELKDIRVSASNSSRLENVGQC